MGRYNGAYSGEGGMGKLTRKTEDGAKAPRDISRDELKRACVPWEENTWKPGALTEHGRDGAPKHDSYNMEPVAAAPLSGKYAKKGGSGQRSGS